MHRYMRAVGFSRLSDRDDIRNLLTEIVQKSKHPAFTAGHNTVLAEFCHDFAENMGIAVCGEFDREQKFTYEYFYPYLRGRTVTTNEDVSVERHAAQESYAGVCDDNRIGVSLIFYLQNMIPYLKLKAAGQLPVKNTNLSLVGLSVEGTILFPIIKNENDRRRSRRATINRNNLIAAARQGDEDAIESLTHEDMDTYTIISKRIAEEDVFSLVDTFFMPYGVECDHYSVMGEILACRRTANTCTGEEIYHMQLSCNDLALEVCINALDLVGEPQVGRRFKGVIWAQGWINFPEFK